MENLHEQIRQLKKENEELRHFKESLRSEQVPTPPILAPYIEEIVDQIPGHLACVDANTLVYQYVNKAFQKSFSVPQSEIIGSHIKDIIGEENYQFALKYIDQVRKGQTISYENTFKLSSGRRWVKVNYVPSFNSNGDVASILVLSYDITEKKEAEIALKVSEEKYRLLIEESSDPFFSFSPDGTYTYVNKAFAQGLQKDQKSIIGKSIWDVFDKEEADKRFTILKKAFETGEILSTEVRVPRSNGDLFFITTVTPIKDEEGNINSLICISKDITLRKRAEIELKKSEEYLRIANATKDKFFSILAHDLKNPFNTLIGLTQLLYDSSSDDDIIEMKRFAKAIHTTSHRTHKLLENLLDWSRSQTGRIEFKPELIKLNPLVSEIAELYQDTINSKSINLSINIATNQTVYADKNMMHTIIRNLLMNALKFTHDGGLVRIEAENLANEVLISVHDSGMGIEKEKIDKLFLIDEKLVTADTESKKGTGLGLILCKEFVDRHKGKIWAESTCSKGSTFKVSLPTN